MNYKIFILTLIIFSSILFAFDITGYFKVNGTVYKADGITPAPEITVELYTLPNGKGEKIISLKSNKQGNFISDKKINFSIGLYPKMIFKNTTKYMQIPAKTGNCSLCHKSNKLTIK